MAAKHDQITIATEDRLSRLTPAQRALFEKRARGENATAPRYESIPRRPPAESCPLSFAQQRLWFLDQLTPGNPFYNIAQAVGLEGDLHIGILRRVLRDIVARHESLRTRFELRDGEPRQVIVSHIHTPLPVVDLSGVGDEIRLELAQRVAETESRLPFDLSRGGLVRGMVLRMHARDHLVLFTMHHVVSDAWSMSVLVREVSALYGAYVRRQAPPLPDLPIQYADYAVWQRDWLKGGVLEQQLSYWRERLQGVPILELPTDRTRPIVQDYAGSVAVRELSPELASTLGQVSRREGVTLFMTLLAMWKALLSRYSGQTDIVVGSPIANRQRSEFEGLIGFFVNTLVLRTGLSGNPSLRELLQRVRETALGAYAHQDLPFEYLVEQLQPRRDLSRNPFFQVLLQFQELPFAQLSFPGLTLKPVDSQITTTHFDLELHPRIEGDRFFVLLIYSGALFDEARINRMLAHYEQLLLTITNNPDQRLGEVDLLTEAEKRHILIEWNATARECEWNDIAELVERQVQRSPDRIAAVFEQVHLSYGELNRRAGQVATALRRHGIEGAEARVGLCVPRGLEMVTVLLGILKAGAAYVPLDPAYPRARLAYMVENSGAKVVINHGGIANEWAAGNGRVVIDLGDLLQAAAGCGIQSSRISAEPQQLGYIIYTSGSTGEPKGIGLPQEALVNLLRWYCETLEPGLRTVQFSSLSFDASFHEIFHTWMTGGTLLLITDEIQRDVDALAAVIERERAQKIMVPAMLLGRLTERLAENNSSVRELLSTAEALQITHRLADWFSKHDCRLHNHYGPSETHVVTWHGFTGNPLNWAQQAPIGRPIANTQIYILDANLKPVPVGVVGELYAGGVSLARGYELRPDLTAEKFLPDPFTGRGARMYRSGDSAMYRQDGTIEYLGRRDNQVKVRGFRIEIGDVEGALSEHPGVRDNVVTVGLDSSGEKRLVAYVTPRAQGATAVELRRYLRQRLPDYMIPSAFVTVDRFPLTPSGKVDRRALTMPGAARPDLETHYEPPATPAEQVLAAIWEQVLGVDQIGVHDNFFDLGGHSLLGTQLISRVRTTFGVELSVRQLFENATIASFAQVIAEGIQFRGVPEVAPVTPVPRDIHLPLSFGQQRLWFLDQMWPGTPVYNILTAGKLEGHLDETALSRTLTEIVRRHEVLRTTFHRVEGEPVQVIHPAAPVPLPLIDLSDARQPVIEKLIRDEGGRPFDLATGPLFRVTLLRVGPIEHILLFTMHHIVYDGWSTAVLLREVAALYEAFHTSQPSPLPALPIQYADYAVWQKKVITGEMLDAQWEYWKRQLDGAPMVLDLPTDLPRPAVETNRGAVSIREIASELTNKVKRLSRDSGASLFMTLLAAWQTLLWRYSGQNDILVGSPIANRTRGETEGLIGFFVNTLVLRGRLSDTLTFRELLDQARETTLGAYAHQDLPFELLVERLQPQRDLSRAPLTQVLFVLQNTPTVDFRLSGLQLSALQADTGTAKVDLTLAITESNSGLAAAIEYATDIFEAPTVATLLRRFENLLTEVVSAPERALSSIPILTAEERIHIFQVWNRTEADLPREPFVHSLFEQQVLRTPDLDAVTCGSRKLTYTELNERANQLAHYLRSRGIGPEARVGICLDRTVDLPVTLLGVLKAGAAYVPVDPGYPRERVALVWEDANVSIILTSRNLLDKLPRTDVPVVSMDANWDRIAAHSNANPLIEIHPMNLVYVIYTSGSTGKPKGVAVAHQSLVNYLAWCLKTYPAESALGAPVHTSLGFDLTVTSLFVPLLRGEPVHLLPTELEALANALRDGAAYSLVKLTPSHLALLHERSDLLGTKRVGVVVVGGEALHAAALRQSWLRGARIFNEYGPTETVVGSSAYEVSDLGSSNAAVPIGSPIFNTQIYIHDRFGMPVPPGVYGEICIGGLGIVRGYLQRPDQTAERFVPNPYSTTAGERLYRTGDLGRFRRDGILEYAGRIDDQIKIRGHRVEPGEIEAVLRSYPGVQAAAVIAAPLGTGPNLTAYVVCPSTPPSETELRAYLQQRLPDYMIPNPLVFLSEMPLSSHGKLLKSELAQLVRSRAVPKEDLEPRDPLELELLQVWQQVLGVPGLHLRSDFFDEGGHSLFALRLIDVIWRRFAIQVPVESVFEAPTVEQFSAYLKRHHAGNLFKRIVTVQPEGDRIPFFCVPPLGYSLMQYRPLVRRLSPNQPVYALQFKPLHEWDDERKFTVTSLATEYVRAIREVQPEGPYQLGGWSSGGVMSFEIASQLRAQGQRTALLAMFDSWAPGSRRRPHDAEFFALVAQGLARQHGSELKLPIEPLRHMSPGERVDFAVNEGIRAGLFETSSREQVGAVLRGLFAHHMLPYDYHPQMYDGPILLFRAAELSDEDQQEISAEGIPHDSPTFQLRGWGECTTGPVDVVDVPGTHSQIVFEPSVAVLAHHLDSALEAISHAVEPLACA